MFTLPEIETSDRAFPTTENSNGIQKTGDYVLVPVRYSTYISFSEYIGVLITSSGIAITVFESFSDC